MNEPTEAYDKAQAMILNGADRDDIEMSLIKEYPDLNAKGLIPTIVRRAYKDLS